MPSGEHPRVALSDFPASRDDIVEQARRNGTPAEAVDRLSKLRDEEFDNVAQVMDATND